MRLTAKQAPHRPDTAPATVCAEWLPHMISQAGLKLIRRYGHATFHTHDVISVGVPRAPPPAQCADRQQRRRQRQRLARAQIAAAQSGDTISFAPSLAGQTITLTSGVMTFAKSLTIQGRGADQLTISGNFQSRVFRITGSTNQVAIRDLAITGGCRQHGGAISNSATLRSAAAPLRNFTYIHPGAATAARSTTPGP